MSWLSERERSALKGGSTVALLFRRRPTLVHKNRIPDSRWTAREMVTMSPANVPTNPSGYALSRPQEPPINPESVVQGTTY